MGYGQSTASAFTHLKDKVTLALADVIAPLSGNDSHPQADLIRLISANPKPGIDGLMAKIQTADSITVESTDSELKTAVLNPQSIELLRDIYGLNGSP